MAQPFSTAGPAQEILDHEVQYASKGWAYT
jgi:hypothetical protein